MLKQTLCCCMSLATQQSRFLVVYVMSRIVLTHLLCRRNRIIDLSIVLYFHYILILRDLIKEDLICHPPIIPNSFIHFFNSKIPSYQNFMKIQVV